MKSLPLQERMWFCHFLVLSGGIPEEIEFLFGETG